MLFPWDYELKEVEGRWNAYMAMTQGTLAVIRPLPSVLRHLLRCPWAAAREPPWRFPAFLIEDFCTGSPSVALIAQGQWIF